MSSRGAVVRSACAVGLSGVGPQSQSLARPRNGASAGTALAEVDSVLATTEVQQLLDEEGLSLALLPDADREVTAAGTSAEEQDGVVYGYPGGAGGYLEFIFRCWHGW